MKKLLCAGLLGLIAALASAAPSAGADNRKAPDPKWLRDELERIRAKHHLPALAASLVVGDRVVAASAVGHRRVGDPRRVTQNDRFCIGSVTKPMTSLLVAALVEKGVLSFDTTLAKMFPELKKDMQPSYRKVTVRMLLSHTSGMPGGPKKAEPRKPTPDDLGLTMAHRYQYVRNAVAGEPEAKPGEKHIYGGGSVIVVSYLERKLKKPYEELMEEHVFRPLGMTTAGKFVMVSGPDKLDGPWPHSLKDGNFVPVPLLIGKGFSRAPAGGVCLSIVDFGKWASAHLQGENGHSNVVRSTTFRELHRLHGPHATMSFGRGKPGWAGGADVLSHGGAHVGIAASVHIVPAHNFAICVATNSDYKEIGEPLREVKEFLARRAMAMRHKGKGK
jgi:CubicO group peptidase (beta-lactamase class C family)